METYRAEMTQDQRSGASRGKRPANRGRHRAAATVITDASPGRSRDLMKREHRYLLTMGLRTACFVGMLWAPGVWRWVLLAGAAFLPGLAVMLANAVDQRRRTVGDFEPGAPGAPKRLALTSTVTDESDGEVIEAEQPAVAPPAPQGEGSAGQSPSDANPRTANPKR